MQCAAAGSLRTLTAWEASPAAAHRCDGGACAQRGLLAQGMPDQHKQDSPWLNSPQATAFASSSATAGVPQVPEVKIPDVKIPSIPTIDFTQVSRGELAGEGGASAEEAREAGSGFFLWAARTVACQGTQWILPCPPSVGQGGGGGSCGRLCGRRRREGGGRQSGQAKKGEPRSGLCMWTAGVGTVCSLLVPNSACPAFPAPQHSPHPPPCLSLPALPSADRDLLRRGALGWLPAHAYSSCPWGSSCPHALIGPPHPLLDLIASSPPQCHTRCWPTAAPPQPHHPRQLPWWPLQPPRLLRPRPPLRPRLLRPPPQCPRLPPHPCRLRLSLPPAPPPPLRLLPALLHPPPLRLLPALPHPPLPALAPPQRFAALRPHLSRCAPRPAPRAPVPPPPVAPLPPAAACWAALAATPLVTAALVATPLATAQPAVEPAAALATPPAPAPPPPPARPWT